MDDLTYEAESEGEVTTVSQNKGIIRQGSICRCVKGHLGVVERYDQKRKLWIGKHLEHGRLGRRWQSKKPSLVGEIYQQFTVSHSYTWW